MRQVIARRIVASYSILVGISILITWATILGTGNIPEALGRPFELSFHVSAEVSSAIVLIGSGIGLINSAPRWARNLSLISLGMLFYAAMNAVGIFTQDSNTALAILLVAVAFSTIMILILSLSLRNRRMD